MFKKDVWEVSILSKRFQSLEIEPSATLFIFYGWQWENLLLSEIS